MHWCHMVEKALEEASTSAKLLHPLSSTYDCIMNTLNCLADNVLQELPAILSIFSSPQVF